MSLIPTDEFFDRPKEAQQRLIDNGHVVNDGELATKIPSEDETGVYVFEEPVEELFINVLKRGKYTAAELAAEFPLNDNEVNELIQSLKTDRLDPLSDHFGVIRVADTEGPAYVYTVESIPFEARIRDPTLGNYLLVANDQFPLSEQSIKTDHHRRARETYEAAATDYWGIPVDEFGTRLDDAVGFADSTLGPLPVFNSLPNVSRAVDRLLSVDSSYRRKRHNEQRVERGIAFRKTRCRRDPSLPAFQEFALYLADINRFAIVEHDPQVRSLAEQAAHVFYRCLHGSMWPGESTEWVPFEVTEVQEDLTLQQRRVLDIVDHQPAINRDFVDRWGFADGSALHHYLNGELDRFAFRNAEGYICATESARRLVIRLVQEGAITVSKTPPVVPPNQPLSLDLSRGTSGDHHNDSRSRSRDETSSGVDWSPQ